MLRPAEVAQSSQDTKKSDKTSVTLTLKDLKASNLKRLENLFKNPNLSKVRIKTGDQFRPYVEQIKILDFFLKDFSKLHSLEFIGDGFKGLCTPLSWFLGEDYFFKTAAGRVIWSIPDFLPRRLYEKLLDNCSTVFGTWEQFCKNFKNYKSLRHLKGFADIGERYMRKLLSASNSPLIVSCDNPHIQDIIRKNRKYLLQLDASKEYAIRTADLYLDAKVIANIGSFLDTGHMFDTTLFRKDRSNVALVPMSRALRANSQTSSNRDGIRYKELYQNVFLPSHPKPQDHVTNIDSAVSRQKKKLNLI